MITRRVELQYDFSVLSTGWCFRFENRHNEGGPISDTDAASFGLFYFRHSAPPPQQPAIFFPFFFFFLLKVLSVVLHYVFGCLLFYNRAYCCNTKLTATELRRSPVVLTIVRLLLKKLYWRCGWGVLSHEGAVLHARARNIACTCARTETCTCASGGWR